MTELSAFLDFANQYVSSRKEPDLAITPDFMIESGCGKSWPNLQKDIRLWLLGGGPHVTS